MKVNKKVKVLPSPAIETTWLNSWKVLEKKLKKLKLIKKEKT